MKQALVSLVLLAVLLPGSFSANAAGPQPPADPVVEATGVEATGVEAQVLHSSDLPPVTDPEDCGVPLEGPFGKDAEAFRGGDQGYRYEFSPDWGNQETVAAVSSQEFLTAAVIHTEQIVALWKTPDGLLQYSIWNGSWQAMQQIPTPPAGWIGRPAILSAGTRDWEVFISAPSGKIYRWQPELTSWLLVKSFENASDARSGPEVVATDPQHTLLFYWNDQNFLRFTERQGSIGSDAIWREKPLTVGKPYTAHLPMIALQSAANAPSPQVSASSQATAADGPSPAASGLSAFSPDGSRVSVFFVTPRNQLWAVEWTRQNSSDWHDARWTKLMENVAIEKPAVSSRHVNHLAVAVRDLSGMAYLIEWTGLTGWQAPYSLNRDDFSGPLALAPTFVDSLSIFGVDAGGAIWQNIGKADGSWQGWVQLEGGEPVELNTLSAVVSQPNDMMLVYQAASGENFISSRHFTSMYQPPEQDVAVSPGGINAYPHGQQLIWVDNKSLWVSVQGDDDGKFWEANAVVIPPKGDVGPLISGTALLPEDAPYQDSSDPVMVSADIDQDSDDEVAVATWYTYTDSGTDFAILSVTVLDFAVNAESVTISPVGLVEPFHSSLNPGTIDSGLTTSLTWGDLNGDNSANELAVFWGRPENIQTDGMFLNVYQYNAASVPWFEKMVEKIKDFHLPHDTWSSPTAFPKSFYQSNVQVAAGNLYRQDLEGAGSKQQIVVSHVTNYLAHDLGFGFYCLKDTDWCFTAFPTLRTYEVNAAGDPWTLIARDEDMILSSDSYWWDLLAVQNGNGHGDSYVDHVPMVSFHFGSAMDSADINGDGLDEIALSYADRIVYINPRIETENHVDVKLMRIDEAMPGAAEEPFNYRGLMRTLSTGDIDLDGKAEILAESFYYNNFLPILSTYVPKLSVFQVMGDETLLATNQYPLPLPGSGGRLHAVLMGDSDGDSFLSKLKYCVKGITDYKILAVLNGAPRWYDPETGKPINNSRGYYTTTDGKSTSTDWGTSYTRGASITLGFKQEINTPVIAQKIGEISASVKTEVMQTNGLNESWETYNSSSKSLLFESGLGIVIYQVAASDCYFYDIFKPGFEQDTSLVVTCTPATPDKDVYLKDLNDWQNLDRVASWVDVGHHAPDGSLSNNLGIPGNYWPVLPVDSYMVLYEADPIHVEPSSGETAGDWTWTQGKRASRTQSYQEQFNITSSAGAEVLGVTFETSLTSGLGESYSDTMSWSEELTFYGRVWNFDHKYDQKCYTVVPYVYEAQAQTLAGIVYPYWEMDYYAYDIGKCR